MPYIAQKSRVKLDSLIDELAGRIVSEAREQGDQAAFTGLLNYTCTRLALKILRLQFGDIRYWLVALVSGTFKNISDEFYRRLAIPYEDKQIAKNGDVDLYKEFSVEIEKI